MSDDQDGCEWVSFTNNVTKEDTLFVKRVIFNNLQREQTTQE